MAKGKHYDKGVVALYKDWLNDPLEAGNMLNLTGRILRQKVLFSMGIIRVNAKVGGDVTRWVCLQYAYEELGRGDEFLELERIRTEDLRVLKQTKEARAVIRFWIKNHGGYLNYLEN